jgi:hypothetical protein
VATKESVCTFRIMLLHLTYRPVARFVSFETACSLHMLMSASDTGHRNKGGCKYLDRF